MSMYDKSAGSTKLKLALNERRNSRIDKRPPPPHTNIPTNTVNTKQDLR